jgi:uncharacterized protein (TIRG00374 family)
MNANATTIDPAVCEPNERPKGKWRRYSGLIIGLLVLGVVVYLGLHIGEARQFVELVKRADPLWLLAGAGYQALTYVINGAVWYVTLKHFGSRVSLRRLTSLSLAKLSMEKMMPAGGLGGSMMLVRSLESKGASEDAAAASLIVDTISLQASRAISIVVSVAILWAFGGLHYMVIVVALVFALFSAAILGAIFALIYTNNRSIPKWMRRLPGVGPIVKCISEAPPEAVENKLLLWKATLLKFLMLVLQVATLDAMLRSIGYSARVDHLFASFSMSSIASIITLIPGGIGAFEGFSILMLGLLKVPIAAGLAATLMLRAFILWLPMIPGFFVLRHESRHLVE